MKFTYIGTEVTGINRGAIEGEFVGNATPQEFIHGYEEKYYKIVGSTLTPLTVEEKEAIDYISLFNSRKLSKRAELKKAFEEASVQNVTVGDTTYFGGKESAHDLKGSFDLLSLGGAVEMTIVDTNSQEGVYTMEEALAIISNIALQYQEVLFKKHSKYREVDAAESLEDLELISWTSEAE